MSKSTNQRRTKEQRPGRGRNARARGVPMALGAVAIVAVVLVLWGVQASASGGPPDFTMVAYQGQDALGGEESTLRSLVGTGTPVVLNFWASSCPPCREEMPGFQRVHDELGDEFLMLGVDIGPFVRLGTHDGARAFLSEYGISYPAAYATSDDPVRDYEVRGMPTTLFFDGSGEIVNKHTGFMPEGQFRRELQALIAAPE